MNCIEKDVYSNACLPRNLPYLLAKDLPKALGYKHDLFLGRRRQLAGRKVVSKMTTDARKRHLKGRSPHLAARENARVRLRISNGP